MQDTGVIDTDALVIGAGPVGLFQAFQLGLLEVRTQLVDALPHVGGQCAELYPDKPIYDIPGLIRCTGRALSEQLLEQIAPFQVPMHLGQVLSELTVQADGRFALRTDRGTRFVARKVVLAAGAGAFVQRKINLPGLEPLEGQQIFYGQVEAGRLADQRVLVMGGDESALRQALALAQSPTRPRQIILAHRRDAITASDELLTQWQALRTTGTLEFMAGQLTACAAAPQAPLQLGWLGVDGQTRSLEVDAIVAHLGLSPKLGPIAQWGLALERKQVPVNTASFETATPGLYAVGDINTYPGKRKLIVSGFHEATLAGYAIAEALAGRPIHLQYTTTSPRLHALLGVKDLPREPRDNA